VLGKLVLKMLSYTHETETACLEIQHKFYNMPKIKGGMPAKFYGAYKVASNEVLLHSEI
jgi:hypothetical protein